MQFLKLEKPMSLENPNSSFPKPVFEETTSQHQCLFDIPKHWSGFVHHCSASIRQPQWPSLKLGFPNNNAKCWKTHLQMAMGILGDRAKAAFSEGLSRFSTVSELGSSKARPFWARASLRTPGTAWPGDGRPVSRPNSPATAKMSTEAIEERLAGVPVYALSNSNEEFVLISGIQSGKSLGLLCFRKEDAEALLEQMKSVDPGMRRGSKVVAVALNKVFQLKVDGVAFRFIPDSSQIMNALREKEKGGDFAQSFTGVPVFQSRSLILKSQDKRYRPVFFRKEDLENSLDRASHEQKSINPAFRKGDIQVCILEEVIRGMKGEGYLGSNWDDVVFIPPGFDVSVNRNSQETKQHLLTQLRRT